ncbi:MAG TPA: formyltetrahydrofolate deformylase [Caldithrix abyssi]|uniref:Formyltetrahydrofolate deformylase n=1 Tax=Caldithrix abyssi TaxID=187145 RepID=A0A7V5H4H7_CALAY|nr:formyltetrahydrofolate deformylase [Caldithrix abyssi]
MDSNKLTAVLLLTCPDRVGLISRISHFIFERQGNIIDLDEHVDQEQQLFSIRVAWDMTNFTINAQQLQEAFAPLAKEFQATWSLRFLEQKSRVAIFVSKRDHCLNEILWRYQLGEYNIEICCIVSNHSNLKPIADQYQIPVHVFPITKNNKKEQETKELQLLQKYQVDTIVLARYMQILSPQFVKHYPNRIINIHHSFLPAFAGSNPYRQAFERGVKIIGATSHYVTEELDQGPIIEQDVIRISHKDTLKDLIRKGRDLERLVLAKALRYHFEHRILVHGRKTIIFE